MKLRTEKEGIIYILLLFVLIIFAVPTVNAQNTDACCIGSDGFCNFDSDTNEETCVGKFNSTHSCNNIPDCIDTCCKLSSTSSCQWGSVTQCAISGGVETGLPKDKCTSDFCNSNTVILKGTVKYFDSILASGSDVQVFNPEGILVESDKVGDNGVFVFSVSKSTEYSIRVTAPLNSNCFATVQASVGETDYTTDDIVFSCRSPQSGCMTTWVTEPWEDIVHNCGFRRVDVSPTDTCARVTLENKPAEFMPCGDSPCGNNILESDEDCDIVSGAASFHPNRDSCSDFGSNMQGRVSCSNQCQIITDCVSCSGECNDQRMCTYCAEKCADEPLCGSGCSSSQKIDNLIAEGTYANGLKGISLEWIIPETCTASTIKIFRCEGNSDTNPTACATGSVLSFINSVSGGESSYVDTSFSQSAKSFCYNISTTINTGFQVVTVYSPTLACAPLWDDACLNNPNEPMCVGKNLLVCENGKVQGQAKECSCGCRAKTSSSPASCVGTENDCNACDVCSGPYGLFPYRDYDLTEIYNNTYYSCVGDMRSRLGDEKMCYLDDYSKNKAIIGHYHACAEVSDCYDYRTEASCESNPCGISAVEQGDCKWTSLTENNELGLGVCVPSNPDLQDCTKCNENGILGNYCPQELCLLYGSDEGGKSTCHFNRVRYSNLNIDNSSCMNIKDVACETYDSEEQCIGIDKISFDADIVYDSESNNIVGGTNEYNHLSRDLYGKGKCIWVKKEGEIERCLKDSDLSSKIGIYLFDCNTDLCLKDFTNPETKLFVLDKEIINGGRYSVDELKLLTVQLSEQVLRPTRNTFISISNSEAEFPEYNFHSQKTEFINEVIRLGQGERTLSFFSVDDSKNREEVQSRRISLVPPLQGRVEVDTKLSSTYYESSDTFLTDLSIFVNHDENLNCKADLRSALNSETVIPGGASKSGMSIEWNYDYLPDGSYQLNVNCVDEHLQTFVDNRNLIVDADMSLHNVYPRGETFRSGSIKIGLSTNDTADCYYTTNKDVSSSTLGDGGSVSSAWTRFSSTGGTEHSVNVNAQDNGLNFFYPACYFKNNVNEDKWFTFTMGDVIYFAVDNMPPEIKIYDRDSGAIYDYSNSTLTDFISLRIECEDNSSILKSGTKSYAFGCGADSISVDKYYQEYRSGGVTMRADSMRLSSGGFVDIFAPENYVKVYLEISATDKGGNTRSVTQQINVRNLSFLEPMVTICDIQSGICT